MQNGERRFKVVGPDVATVDHSSEQVLVRRKPCLDQTEGLLSTNQVKPLTGNTLQRGESLVSFGGDVSEVGLDEDVQAG